MKLDNRPRKLLVKGVPAESVEVAQNWYGVRIFPALRQVSSLSARVCRQQMESKVSSDWRMATSLFLSKREVPRNRHVGSYLIGSP